MDIQINKDICTKLENVLITYVPNIPVEVVSEVEKKDKAGSEVSDVRSVSQSVRKESAE